MLYLLDTNAVSDIMAAHPRLTARLQNPRPGDLPSICTITRGEILAGIERLAPGKRRTELELEAASAFASLTCHPVPEAAGDHYAKLKAHCRGIGVALDENDLWIAATCLALGATLVTRDKDFAAIAGLAVEDWTA